MDDRWVSRASSWPGPVGSRHARFAAEEISGHLPDEPDTVAVEEWMLRRYKESWFGLA